VAADAVQAKFVFDGDVLLPEKTPADLELEGDEMIEVHFI
jgi:hypothetical protein